MSTVAKVLYKTQLLFTTFLERCFVFFPLIFQMRKLSLRKAQAPGLVKAYIFLTPLCFSLSTDLCDMCNLGTACILSHKLTDKQIQGLREVKSQG